MSEKAPQPPEPPENLETGALGGPGPLRGRTLRPGSSIAVGVVGALCGLALLVPALLTSPRNLVLIASVVLAMVLLWLFVVRPSAIIHREGIRLVNPLRVVDVTWPAITEVRSKWALEVFAGGTRYTAWGIPADPKRPRYGRSLLTLGVGKAAKRSDEAATDPTSDPTSDPAAKVKVEAQTVAAEVEALVAADRRRPDGPTPRIAHQSWDPVSVGLLVAALAFLAVAVVTG